jgi:hypothetical protein
LGIKIILMRKPCFIFLLLTSAITVFAQPAITWNAPVIVASGYSNVYPRLSLTTGNAPLVTWENNPANKIYSSKWNGSAFTAPITLTPPGVTPFIATWSGAEIAASGDTAYVVFFTEPVMDAKIYMVRSLDGGLSFGDTVRVDVPGTTNIPAFPGVAISAGGHPVVHYMLTDSAMMDAEYVTRKSVNGGNSFMSPASPSSAAPGFVCDCCPASMAISGNHHVLLYRNDDNNIRDIWASFSSDASLTFPNSAETDHTNWNISSCPSSGPSGVISGDSLFSVWMSDATGDARIYLGTTNIHDQDVGLNRQLYPTGTSTQNYPVIAGNGDTLGVVWQGYNGSFQEVLFTSSVTGASGLGVRVDTLTKAFTGHQSRPDIAFADGTFHIVYSDANGSNVKYLSGSISNALTVQATANTNALEFSTAYNDGTLALKINSTRSFPGTCDIYNSTGQLLASSVFEALKGENYLNIDCRLISGSYIIIITDEAGKIYKDKITYVK